MPFVKAPLRMFMNEHGATRPLLDTNIPPSAGPMKPFAAQLQDNIFGPPLDTVQKAFASAQNAISQTEAPSSPRDDANRSSESELLVAQAIFVSLLRQQQEEVSQLTRELAAERRKCNLLKERLGRRLKKEGIPQ